jgi:hypothetical protein
LGYFNWQFPVKLPKNKLSVTIEFHSAALTKPTDLLPSAFIMLNGFMDEKNILTSTQVVPDCKQYKMISVCTFNSKPNINLIILPAFYYPDMYSVSINDKPVSYSSVQSGNRLLMAVNPIPGMVNTIKIKFTGLVWANILSNLSWGIWLIFALYIYLKRLTANKKLPIQNKFVAPPPRPVKKISLVDAEVF